MGMILAQLGTFQFGVNTAAYDQIKRATQYRWSKQPRINNHPAAQFVGAGEDTMTLSGTVYPDYKGGLGQISKMRDAAAQGQPLALYFSYGGSAGVLGVWVIDSIEEEQSYFHANGQPRKQTFTLKISYYGDDGA